MAIWPLQHYDLQVLQIPALPHRRFFFVFHDVTQRKMDHEFHTQNVSSLQDDIVREERKLTPKTVNNGKQKCPHNDEMTEDETAML